MYAGVAGVARLIVARNAGSQPGARPIGKPSSATAGVSKAVKPIVWPNVAAECIGVKKPWMINLPHRCLPVL